MPVNDIIGLDDPILVTGGAGFVGSRVIAALLRKGFRHIKCLVRPSSNWEKLVSVADAVGGGVRLEILRGNLLSEEDCSQAAKDATVIYHLAAGRGEKSFPDAFLNSVVTTRNLLDAARQHGCMRRCVSLSSFSVYSNQNKPKGQLLDEASPVENSPHLRGDAYTFAKSKQDEILIEYGKKYRTPYVIVRPGVVYGPGNEQIHGRVGIGTFGLFLHTGGANPIPLTYVDNCAEAIVLAGLKAGIDGEVFNVVDDDLPSSRHFLDLYKKHVRYFRSVYIPHVVSYLLCMLWEKYSESSHGQLAPVFNRRSWHAYWKKTRYSNEKIKRSLGWTPAVSSSEGLQRYFESCRRKLAAP